MGLGRKAKERYGGSMGYRLLSVIVAAILTAGCAGVREDGDAPAGTDLLFAQFGAGAQRPPYSAARYAGYFAQRGPCLGLLVEGRFATIIWPATARLRSDARGLILSDTQSGARLRLGDYIEGTGGAIPRSHPQSLGEPELTATFPIECARWPEYEGWIGVLNPGFRRGTAR